MSPDAHHDDGRLRHGDDFDPSSGDPGWARYRRYCRTDPHAGLTLDVSRVPFTDALLEADRPAMRSALRALQRLERGGIANPDEHEMVGHYWLRAPSLAPTAELADDVERSVRRIRRFAAEVRAGDVRGATGRFEHVLHIGIGGSTTGPQLLADALTSDVLSPRFHFLDNSDPEGIAQTLAVLTGELGRTLVCMASKSGITPTPGLALRRTREAYAAAGLDLAEHAVAITKPDSDLHDLARAEGWLTTFPIWSWVGGRTSITSAVGLLPLALAGADPQAFLDGAAAMDRSTRVAEVEANPAAMLALSWFWLGDGRGDRAMVVLPYRDRLARFPRYVQQLVMESLGKRLDRAGRTVHQGLTVLGHKGSSDQHSYLQQTIEGTDDAFVVFVEVLDAVGAHDPPVGPGVTVGDHLLGGLVGTREALSRNGRGSVTITLPSLSPADLGALVALLERAVGLYAELVDVNAYDQPAVDKFAALPFIRLQEAAVARLRQEDRPRTAQEVAHALGRPDETETVYRILDRLTRARRGVTAGDGPRFDRRFAAEEAA